MNDWMNEWREPNTNYWRVTKYNPIYRNEKGWYMRDEWMTPCEVGRYFNGVEFKWDEYLIIENAYVFAVVSAMKKLGTDFLKINGLEWKDYKKFDDLEVLGIEKFFKSLKEGMDISVNDIPKLMKLILRNIVWARLESEMLTVNFEYDYYMYFVFKGDLSEIEKSIIANGLFIDKDFVSPHIWADDEVFENEDEL